MAAPPYMKFYIGDYLLDTQHLTTAEHGAYLLLLMAMWRAGGKLPAFDDKLARITRCTPQEWVSIRDQVLPFFKQRGRSLSHKRVTGDLASFGKKPKLEGPTYPKPDPDLTQTYSEKGPENNDVRFPIRSDQIREETPQPPKGGETEDRFDEGWSAYPLAGRENLSLATARQAWSAALAKIDAAGLVTAIRSFGAGEYRSRGGRPKRFDRWLIGECYAAHLPTTGAQPTSAWPGPAALRTWVVSFRGEDWTRIWLDRCGWRDIPRTILAPTQLIAERLLLYCAEGLAESGIAIEVQSEAA